jgi:hypothetical protein
MIMTLIYPNIVPENNLRLPDALTIKHGPARLLSRFVLEGDKAARQMGLRLRLRHDFGELLYLNEREVARGNWFRLVNMYNPAHCDLSPENSYWISGEAGHKSSCLDGVLSLLVALSPSCDCFENPADDCVTCSPMPRASWLTAS